MSEPGAAAREAVEPEVRLVVVRLCVPCIKGEGEECHTPGCALWLHRVDIPIMEELLVDADAFAAARVAEERARVLDDLREALEFLDHSGNQRAVLSGKFSTPSARYNWFNRVRARLRAALRAPEARDG